MAATINTNIASINAQRNLSLSASSLATSMQRLSSGLRVNSAKDDAAGLAISERMNTQVKGLTVAARNANDGISLAQTAEGALGKVGDMLQRMRELAVQASNATNSKSDRTALQAEMTQLGAEIDRVAKQTNFNGQKILDGSFAGAVFQVGANSGDNVTLGALADTRSSKISTVNYGATALTFNVSDTPTPAIANYNQDVAAGALKIQVGSQVIDLEALPAATSSLERLGQTVTAINNKSADSGVTAYMSLKPGTSEYEIHLVSDQVDGDNQPRAVAFVGFNEATTGIGQPTGSTRTILSTEAGVTTALAALPATATAGAGGLAADTAKYSDVATAMGDPAATTTPKVSKTVEPLASALTAYNAALAAAVDNGTTPATLDIAAANKALATLQSAYATNIQDLNVVTNDGLGIGSAQTITNERGLDNIDITTQEGAWVALKKIDSAIDQINGARATLGAMQSRFETAVTNIDIQVENLSAARGRIVDADFAQETANLSRTQILQQAGTAMVAQANQLPQQVLQLLQS